MIIYLHNYKYYLIFRPSLNFQNEQNFSNILLVNIIFPFCEFTVSNDEFLQGIVTT